MPVHALPAPVRVHMLSPLTFNDAQEIGDRLSLALRSLADANEVFGADADARHLIAGDTRAEGITLIRNGVARRIGITAATPVEAGP